MYDMSSREPRQMKSAYGQSGQCGRQPSRGDVLIATIELAAKE